MKKLLSICSALLFGLSVDAAQVHFVASTSLPSQVGQYNSSYISTDNPNVPAMLAFITNSSGPLPTSPGPTWDFSQAQQDTETILRTDIIAPADGPDGDSFANATYAEQDTAETPAPPSQTAWRYYSLTNQGRTYYGSYVPGTEADGLALFSPPTMDIPGTVTNGQTWARTTSWNSTLDGYFPIYYQFSDTSIVDAQGTLILPSIGSVQAFRVHEIQGYIGTLYGTPYETVTNQYYYWLVPGLGVAVQITLFGNNTLYPATLPFTNSVERMYYASYFTNPVLQTNNPLPGNLHIQLQSGAAVLNWMPFTNSTSYQVQANGSLTSTNWRVLGLTSSTNWSDSLTTTQRFYRVVGEP
jgi:hypothetical protein